MTADRRVMSVALPLEQWQWLISLVVNSAYIRAKPIVEAIEAQAKKLDEEDREKISRPQQEAYTAQRKYEAAAAELNSARYELQERRDEVRLLERRINGLKGQLAKQAKRANGHEERLMPTEHALVAELRSDRRTLEAQLDEQAAARKLAEDLLAKAREEWRAATNEGRPVPSFPSIADPIAIEAELAGPLDQKDDELGGGTADAAGADVSAREPD